MPRPDARSRRLLALLAALALLVLAGCGDDDGSTDDPTTTTAERNGDDTTTTDTTEPPPDEEIGHPFDLFDDDLEGVPVDAEVVRAAIEPTVAIARAEFDYRISVDGGLMGSQQVGVSGPIDFDDFQADLSGALDGLEDAIRLRMIGNQAWLGGELPEIRQAMPDGIRWAEDDADRLLELGVLTDPEDTFDSVYLLNGAEEVVHLGEIDRDGETLDHYRFVLDVDAAIEAAPADRRDGVAGIFSVDGDNDPVMVAEVAIDADGHMRSLWIIAVLEPTEEERQSLGADTIRLELALSIDAIGEAVEVEAPDPDEVVDLDEVPGLVALLG